MSNNMSGIGIHVSNVLWVFFFSCGISDEQMVNRRETREYAILPEFVPS
jgi:hypothetical protein